MAEKKRSRGIYWIAFFASVALFFGVYAVAGGYCSLVLAPVCTFFAQALDLL